MKVVFLTLDEVIALHADQIKRYGGRPGIRDLGLLQFALGTPSATFEGRLLHEGLHEMAAAHLFHIVMGLRNSGQDYMARMVAAEALART